MIYLFNVFTFLVNIFLTQKYLHIYQLKDYQNDRYFKYFSKKHTIFMFLSVIFVVFNAIFKNFSLLLFSNIVFFIVNLFVNTTIIKTQKTPLKFTGKIKRLYLISTLLNLIFVLCPYYTILSFIVMMVSPAVSNFLNIYDKIKNKKYISHAVNKIKNSKIKVIAITGSNGKTSVKNILFDILKTEYRVLKTPASYNTPLGISKYINNNDIDKYDFIILEYGARRKGDIEKLCNLFGADYGIVTTIAPQHLETFKTISNIQQTKNELPLFLNEKFCVFNTDNRYSVNLFKNKIGLKSEISLHNKTDIHASKIKINNGKTEFVLNVYKKKYKITTALLGKHNITNILLACALACHLNIKTENIISSIENLQPIPHRLELIRTHINVLDDSYNCSIASAKEAIETLKTFKGRKMVVTPGIIEGGKRQSQINFELGEMLADFDFIVIVGNTNKEAILKGLNTKNFESKNIFYANTLEDAKQYFSLLKENENLLLLNDLPDDYS